MHKFIARIEIKNYNSMLKRNENISIYEKFLHQIVIIPLCVIVIRNHLNTHYTDMNRDG